MQIFFLTLISAALMSFPGCCKCSFSQLESKEPVILWAPNRTQHCCYTDDEIKDSTDDEIKDSESQDQK